MPYVQVQDGTNLYYYDWGYTSAAPVVLIHGWPVNSASWEAQARVLVEAGHRVIAYDRRGFGRSDWPSWGYDYNTLADDLAAVMDRLDLHDATLVGFSMGGGEVARYLSRHGAGRVSKAVLISSVTPYLLKTESNTEGVDESVFEGMIEGLKKDRPAFLQQFFPRFYGHTMLHRPVSDAMLDFTLAMAMTGSPKATIDLVHAWSETDFRDDLAAVSVRTLVIHGDADATVPIDVSARRAVKFLAHGELIEYEGAPHGLIATHADRVNADLLAFLKT
jgi:pimeloyl-ACP methyl ester carboxylesterase